MGKDSGTRSSARKSKQVKAQPKKVAKASVKAKKIVKPAKPTKPAKPVKTLKTVSKLTTKKVEPKAKAKVVTKAVAPKPPKPAKVPKVKAAPKPSGPKGYTAAQYSKFKQFKEKFNDYSNQQLKDLLKKNFQSMTGNKDDLIYKCADGATLGRIPRCPKCFGGRPKFDFKLGTYYCSGYRDDVDFKNCHSTFQLSELKRDTWQN